MVVGCCFMHTFLLQWKSFAMEVGAPSIDDSIELLFIFNSLHR